MEENIIVLMEKNKENGFLENQIDTYDLGDNAKYLKGIYLISEDDGKNVYFKLSTDKDINDDEFDFVYDNYTGENFNDDVLSISEVDDVYNPTWEFKMKFDDNREDFEQKLKSILNVHDIILKDCYEKLK